MILVSRSLRGGIERDINQMKRGKRTTIRVPQGYQMAHKRGFEAVSKLPGAKRYEYFIKKVADNEILWGLYNDGWAMVADDNGNEMIPFWPREEFADACCLNDWRYFKAEEIDLYEFIEGWLVDMKEDGLLTAIFYTKDDKGVVVEPDKLLEDLNEELENY
jgi:hypothetical protein